MLIFNILCSKNVLKKKSARAKSNSSRSKVKVNNDDPEGDTTAQYMSPASGIAEEDVLFLESQYTDIKGTLTTIEGKIIDGYQVTKQNIFLFIIWQTLMFVDTESSLISMTNLYLFFKI